MRIHMAISRRFSWLVSAIVLALVASVAVAQGHGHDRDDAPPGHGGVPPGQAKKYGDDGRGMPPGQAKKYGYDDDRRMPPGQAKKVFRDQDRANFYAHYRRDADRWRGYRRPVFVPGQVIERTYYMQPVPRTYWVGVAPPPPPGYQYGYYQGYVVAYNPTTRVVGDVLDLVAAATGH
jgi:hypothetical protein